MFLVSFWLKSNDQNNLLHKFLLTNIQVSRICKAFANNFSPNIKLSKTQLNKIEQSGGFLGILLGPLLKTELPLMTNVLEPLVKRVLRLSAAATGAAIHKKMFGFDHCSLDLQKRRISQNIIRYITCQLIRKSIKR